ncbi:MAG: 50S ribosomal protein L18 [Candidatus Aureabacteria bacterium]|nr:50S ribosomal protein L18 [Candidatus Auribacterota bacterium]
MINKVERKKKRDKKHLRIRKNMIGIPECLRACVFRSNNNMSVQFVDDESRKVVAGFSTLSKEFKESSKGTKNNVERAKNFGKFVGAKVKEKNISSIVFDRAGFKYHGKVKALAEGMREEGLKF